jgi:hypothetical protein
MRGPRAAALMGAVVLGLGGTTAAYAATTGSASGAGALEGAKRQFSFSAKLKADGTVKGQAELTSRSAKGKAPYKLHITISCMKKFDDGKTVVFGGTTKRTNDPNLVDAVFFAVQDNGKRGKGRDKISRVAFWDDDPTTTGDPQACMNNVVADLEPGKPLALETIKSGNIRVK